MSLSQTDLASFKERLETEKRELEEKLKTVGRVNPDNPADWEATPGEFDEDSADPNDRADKIEEFEERAAVLNTLEAQYDDVLRALAKIEEGKYGICEVSDEEIEIERLNANPAARTCKAHMNQ